MSSSAAGPEDWIQTCEHLIRAGELDHLVALLQDAPLAADDPVRTFCQARLAVARAEYESAARMFQEVMTTARVTGNKQLHQASLVWLAYCHTLLANYTLARTFIDGVAQVLSTDDPLYAWIFFIRGVLAADSGTMAEAQVWMEQARDLAVQRHDIWFEARCCTNLAVFCMSQGQMDRSGRMVQRVERLNREGVPYPQQLMQVRNIEVYRLRLLGDMESALQHALPLPEETDDGSTHYRGWLALTTATVATDMGNFALAEQAWQCAARLIERVQDNDFSSAELLWERAWLRFRQGRLDEAYQNIHRALNLIESQVDNEHYHALTIAAIIDMARDDFAFVGRNLREASSHFRTAKHHVGLVSVLVHVAAYHLRGSRQRAARLALVEALTLLREYRLYGIYYWHPETMVLLCKLAIQEDWGDLDLDQSLPADSLNGTTALPDLIYLETHPKDVLGDFAASLAAHRLAADHWEEFAPLLADPRPQVRQRAARVLRATNDPLALARLECLAHDPDPALRQWYSEHIAPRRGPAVVVHSFGRFEILINNQPLKLRNAGSGKAKVLFGALLLAGEQGLESGELALLLWPDQQEHKQRPALQTTVSVLRNILKGALDGDSVIWFNPDTRRYSVRLRESRIWWDWDQLRQIAEPGQRAEDDGRLHAEIETVYYEDFMGDFLALLPRPTRLSGDVERRWNSVHDLVAELVEEHEGKAAMWLQQLGEE